MTMMRVVAAALALVLCQISLAFGHASLNTSSPLDGSVLAEAPAGFSLTFSEPVSPLALKLVRPDGSSLGLETSQLKDLTVEIAAPGDLGRGTHVLSWRVVSADGHPIGGSVVFSIGEASAQPPTIEEPIDWPVRSGLWLSKIALYAGLFLGVGGVFFLATLGSSVMAGRRATSALVLVGAAGAVVSAGFQGLDALGAPVARIADSVVWSTGLGTTYGRTVIMALGALAVAGLARLAGGMLAAVVATLALLAAALAPALSGHASAADPQGLMRPAVFLHVLAIAAWTGALVPLGLSLARREAGAPQALMRFSRAIPAIVAVLVVAGLVLTVVQVETPRALVETAYGRLLAVKLGLLAGLFVLAAVNRWLLTTRVAAGDPGAMRRMVRAVALETLVVVAILAVAAGWRFTPPPRVLAAEAALPATVELRSDKAAVVLWIGPARAGPVDIVANVLSVDYGMLEAKEVSVTLSKPDAGIEPFRRRLVRGEGMADWHGAAVTIPLAGVWKVRVDVLISDYEITRLDGEVRIRP